MDEHDTTTVDNYQFLNAVFAAIDHEAEEIAVCAFTESPDTRETWPAYRVFDSAVKRYIDPAATPTVANSYYCISSVAPTADWLKRTAEAFRGLYVLPLDDIGTGIGAKITPDLVPLPPSYIIETSPGSFQYGYILIEPCRDLPTARALLKLVTKDHGDTGGAIATKYMRLPQGYNNKAKYGDTPWQCRLVELNDRRFAIDELLKAFGVDYADLLAEAEHLKRARADRGVATDDEIYDWLVECGLVHSAPDAEGYAAITCPWHMNHTDGQTLGRYSPLGCGGKDFKFARQFKCFHGHCSDKDLEAFLHWYFQTRFVFVRDEAMVFDLQERQLQRHDAFRLATANYWHWGGPKNTTKIPYSFNWLMSPNRVTVNSLAFVPGQSRLFIDHTRQRRLNTHYAYMRDLSKNFDLVLPILKHLKYLFGADTDHALGFIGWTVHHPEDRIQYAMLHIALNHGTGRGWLKQLIRKLLVNPLYVRSTTLAEMMESPFNDFMWQSLVVFFDEVQERTGRYKVQDRIREVITEPQLAINIKHGFKGTAEVFANIIMLSNHLNPLIIPPEDRRIWPVVCTAPAKPTAYYDKLFELLDDPLVVNAFYWYLAEHLKRVPFNPFERAPRNQWTPVVFGGDADSLLVDLTKVVEALRALGAKAIYRAHLVQLLRAMNVELPLAGEAGSAWAQFNNVTRDLSMARSNRIRAPGGPFPDGDNRSVMYLLDADYAPSYMADANAWRAECERVRIAFPKLDLE